MRVPDLINSVKKKILSVVLAALIAALTVMPVSAESSDMGGEAWSDGSGNNEDTNTAAEGEPEITENTEDNGEGSEETGAEATDENSEPAEETGTEATDENGEPAEETGAEATDENGEPVEETSTEVTDENGEPVEDTSAESTDEEPEIEESRPVLPEVDAVPLNTEFFPDDIFRAYVSDFDLDEDGFLTRDEIENIKFIYVNGTAEADGEITSLKGIEFFFALSTLDCSYNALLEEIDVGYNPELTSLDCSFTGIKELNVKYNPAMTCLICNNTDISKLDLSGNTELTDLYCLNTKLPYLELEGNTNLKKLEATGTYEIPSNAVIFDFNEIEGIDISKIVSVENAVFDPETGMLINITDDVKYVYQCNEKYTAIFTLTLTGEALDEEEKLLYTDNGSITITENGFTQNGRETAWTKDYIISATGEEPVTASIIVESGSHHITLDNVKLTGEKEVISIAEGAEVTLDGSQVVITGENGSGILNAGVLDIESGEYTVNNNMVKNGENSSSTVDNRGTLILGENAVMDIIAGLDSPEGNVIVTEALVNGLSNRGVASIYGMLTARGGSGVFNDGDISVYEGGSITAKGDEYGIFSIPENGIFEVCGGKITSAGSIDGINIYSGTFEISSGEVDTQGSRVGICIQADAEMNISGGKIKTTCDYGIENYGKILIDGSMITVGGEVYDIFSGENALFTVTGGSLKLENGTMSEYVLIVNDAADELEGVIYEEYPDEDMRTFGAEGAEYLYNLNPEDCDENGLYYLWKPAKLIPIDEAEFPDSIFRAYIANSFDTNKDGGLSQREIKRAKEILLNGTSSEDGGVESFKGIEHLAYLELLDCSYNEALTDLDLSANNALKVLDISATGITRISLDSNTELTELRCNYCEILFLDLTNNPKITFLQAEGCGYEMPEGVSEFDLNAVEGLDISKIESVYEADFDPETGIISNICDKTSYDYRCNELYIVNIALIGEVQEDNTGTEPEETTTETQEPDESGSSGGIVPSDTGETSETTPEETVTEETGAEGTQPEETKPEETSEAEPLPEDTTSEGENPEESGSEENPEETASEENPEETAEGEENPEETEENPEETTEEEAEEPQYIDISDGSVSIYKDGFVQCGEFMPWNGEYTVSGGGNVSNSVTVESGSHNITFDKVSLKAESGALYVSENAAVTLSGKGTNILMGETGCGISNKGVLNIINGDFEVYDNVSVSGEAGTAAIENEGILKIGQKALVTASASYERSNSGLAGGKRLFGGILNSGSIDIDGDVNAEGNCGIINKGAITVTGGTVTSHGDEYGVFNLEKGSTVNIDGGNVSFKGGNCGTNIFGGSMNISSGDVKSAGDRVGISVQLDTQLKVSGGTLATTCDYGVENYGSISVMGGSVNISGDISDVYGGKDSRFEAADGTVTFEKVTEDAILDIIWPTSTYVIINPYGMELNVSDGVTTNESVISPEMIIVNNGNTDVSINVTGSVSVVDKESNAVNDEIKFADEYYSEETDSLLLWIEATKESGIYNCEYDNTSAAQLALSPREMTKRLITIPSDGGAGYLKIRGEVTVAPNTNWDKVVTGNEVNVAIAFEAKATPKVKEVDPKDYVTIIKSDDGKETIYIH